MKVLLRFLLLRLSGVRTLLFLSRQIFELVRLRCSRQIFRPDDRRSTIDDRRSSLHIIVDDDDDDDDLHLHFQRSTTPLSLSISRIRNHLVSILAATSCSSGARPRFSRTLPQAQQGADLRIDERIIRRIHHIQKSHIEDVESIR